jgi:myosin heavy subunit
MAEEKVILDVEVKGTGKGEASIKSLKGELRSLKNELGQLDPASEAFSEAAKRAEELKKQLKGVNDALENVDPEKAVAPVKSLKAELRELKNELGKLDPSSDAFIRAAKRAGQLQDEIEDVNNTVKAFNPEAKFQAFASVLGGVANGFSAVQGAQALFGSENEDIQKAILKTQGAIALATGLNGLMGMGDAFKNLGTIIKVNVISAFGSLKAALISTGIGALVVALGIAINEIMKYNSEVEKQETAQAGLNKELDKTNEALDKQISKSETIRNAKKGGLNDLKNELKILEASGATEKQLFEKRKEILNAELLNLKVKKYSGLDVTKDIADKEVEIEALKQSYLKELRDKKNKDEKDAKQKQKELLEQETKNAETWKKQAEQKDKDEKDKRYEQRDEEEQSEKLREQKRIELQNQTLVQLKAKSDAKIALAKAEEVAQLQTIQAVANGLNAVGQLVGEQTAAGKALGVATATIDTYVGATKAYAQGGTLGFISAAAVIVAGLANVKRILSVQVPFNSGTPTPSMPSAPSIPQISSSTSINQNNPIPTTQLNVTDSRVYVVETDITDSQNKVKGIVRKATIR